MGGLILAGGMVHLFWTKGEPGLWFAPVMLPLVVALGAVYVLWT